MKTTATATPASLNALRLAAYALHEKALEHCHNRFDISCASPAERNARVWATIAQCVCLHRADDSEAHEKLLAKLFVLNIELDAERAARAAVKESAAA